MTDILGYAIVIFTIIVFGVILFSPKKQNNNHTHSTNKNSKRANTIKITVSIDKDCDKQKVLDSISKQNPVFDYSFLHKINNKLLKEVEDVGHDIEYNTVVSLNRIFKTMMKRLYSEDNSTKLSSEILREPEVLSFIKKHTTILNSSLKYTELPLSTKKLLKKSSYIFSGFKTWHELNEAFSLLYGTDNKKSLSEFLVEIEQINDIYNKKYLKAEYNFAGAAGYMASKWEDYAADGDEYYLQYRTANDGQVRPEHAALHEVTLPPSDNFWNTYYPPNGWNCRCTVVQVLKREHEPTSHEEAMRRGSEALAKDRKEMFCFNSGKDKTLFPFYNIYSFTPCRICKQQFSVADHIMCKVCSILKQNYEEQMVVKKKSSSPQISNLQSS